MAFTVENNAVKRTFYTMRHTSHLGPLNAVREANGMGGTIKWLSEPATQFETVGEALNELQQNSARMRANAGGKNVQILRVEETTVPGTHKLSLSSTLEPVSPTDRFVVIIAFKNSLHIPYVSAKDTVRPTGNGVQDLVWVERNSFDSQADAIRHAAALRFEPSFSTTLGPLVLVGIRRLVTESSEPTIKRTETILS